ncbi:UDP-glucosyltransferase [Operophtera brumata]|uniref:UDP-glucosyltransferase n=1 Tax=Operophtera brumata TaxID=104452 RepID=A0A0L7L448_OPEBR|nr:UDP-glucosyltransferase [Operophtera brumata]
MRLVAPHIEKRSRTPPSFEELKYNSSLVFGNSHVSMGQATRLPQIYKPVGGYHIEDTLKPLPEDLKKLMDEAKHGVIYFSMGSNLKSKDLPEQLKKDLLKVFGTLKQTVLWKFEEVLPDLPKNVHILKWAPQQSILCLLSTTESIHTATPIIGIPVFADQFINVRRAVSKGFAKQVSLSYTMAGELKEAIEDILTDPKYSQKVKELSYIYHDRPVKPGVELVHWVEHVIKTGGAPHLRSPALMVPWYQKIYLDLAALLLIALYILIKVLKLVKPLIFRKNVMLKLLVTTVLLSLCACDAFKILVIFPIPGKSHGILEDTMNIKAIMDKELNMKDYNFVQQLMVNISTSTIQDANVQRLLQDPKQNFDLVLGEWLFSEVYSTLAALYDCPFIWFSTLEPHWQITRLIDEHLNPAYNADILSDASLPYSFAERVNQLWVQIQGVLRYNVVPILRARGKVVPAYEDLVANSSLVLGNSHVSLGLAPRLPQSYKPIGGYHIDSKPSPLPENLQKLMDNSKHGVIYFSMGSNLKSKDIPLNLKQGFLRIFRGLKQTILWKFEEVLPDLPKNVHILTWAPQQSILAHPNCVLFITHGGLLSTTEAVHYGKPIIGIPVFADQFTNVQRAAEKGFGKRVELSYTMDAELKVQIDEILGACALDGTRDQDSRRAASTLPGTATALVPEDVSRSSGFSDTSYCDSDFTAGQNI